MEANDAAASVRHLAAQLAQVCGPQWVSLRQADLLAYARDMWPRSLIRQRAGHLDHPPQVVVWPADAEQTAEVVKMARRRALPVIPFGAGSGVCGGTLPLRGGVVLDLKRMDRLIDLDQESGLLEVEAGAVGEWLERELNRRGWTCGHFPSSMQCSTVGGWIAARGAGQCSSRYGKMEDLVREITFVTAEGRVRRLRLPHAGSGWSAVALLVGSEGTLGVITSACLVVRRLAERRWLRGYRFPDPEAGLRAMRLMLREGLRPAVLRLYDEFDTVIALGRGPAEEPAQSLLSQISGRLSGPLKSLFSKSLPYLLMNSWLLNRAADLLPGGCLLVVVQEGEADEVEYCAQRIGKLCLEQGADDRGPGPAEHWLSHRYDISYRQSGVFSAGAFVDTMEVATTWERVTDLYRAVRRAVGGQAFIMAHFSHAYREGCSIYFTFAGAARSDAEAAALYDRIWDSAQHAVRDHGGVVSHHHGIGCSKGRYLLRQLESGAEVLQAIKEAIDPAGVFNPEKLGLTAGAKMPAEGKPRASEGAARGEKQLRRALGRALGQEVIGKGDDASVLLRPRDASEVSIILREASAAGVALAIRGSQTRHPPPKPEAAAKVVLSTSRMNALESICSDGLWAVAGGGIQLGDLHRRVQARGLQLAARTSQSGTLGGWLSAGAAMLDPIIGLRLAPVLALEVVLPGGRVVRTVPSPRSATGPELMALWLGTRGCLGVITRAWLKLAPRPQEQIALAAGGADWQRAAELLRALARGFPAPAEARARLRREKDGAGWWVAAHYQGTAELVKEAGRAFRRAAAAVDADCLSAEQAERLLFSEAPLPEGGRALSWSRLLRALKHEQFSELDLFSPESDGCLMLGAASSGGDGQQDAGLDWLERIRARLDPEGICNPQQWRSLRGGGA